MLTKCPECDLQVSDKAVACPHCGYPLRTDADPQQWRKAGGSGRRRLPNGFGQISEIKGKNLRNPYRAMVTVGKTEEGRPISRPLKPRSYFPTYGDAYAALVEYNKNPYDLDSVITVRELYARWSEEYFKTLNESSRRTTTSAWSYCSSVYDMNARDLRARHIKGCMEDGVSVFKGTERRPSPNIKSRIKSLFNLMLDYAVEYEIVEKNYARTFNLSDDVVKELGEARHKHIPFTDEEMQTLWEHVKDVAYVDVILIQCYAGWRPRELGLIRLENVDLENWTFVGGMKTDAGKNRTVPIHSRIRGLVTKKYEEAKAMGSEYLINCKDSATKSLTYDKYKWRFFKIRDLLGLNPLHRPHDGRMQFVTMAKRYGVDEYAIKYIVGHAISDITEKVYTKRDPEWLRSEMEKIK